MFLLRLLQQTQFSHPSLVKRKTCEWQRESVCYKGELFPTVADQGHVDRLSRESSGPYTPFGGCENRVRHCEYRYAYLQVKGGVCRHGVYVLFLVIDIYIGYLVVHFASTLCVPQLHPDQHST